MKKLMMISLLLLSGAANSALVTYIVEGDLTQVSTLDPYHLDGAHYLHEIVVNTSTQHSVYVVDPYGTSRTSYYNESNAWVSAVITLTNRPHGAADRTVVANQAFSTDFDIQNVLESNPYPGYNDGIHVGNAALTGEFDGLITGGLHYSFPKSYFSVSGPNALPSVIKQEDMIAAQSNVSWGSGASTGASSSSQYVVSNGSLYTAVVPIPPALWFFGSGLLGLIGIARRKAA